MKNTILILSILLNVGLLTGSLFVIKSLGGIQYMLWKMKNRGVTGTYEHRKSIFEMLPNETKDIIFLGDSLTEQCEWSEMLQDARVKNRGISGDMTVGLLNRLQEVTDRQPAQIFLLIGINDLLFHDADYVIENYKTIVHRILSETPDTELLLQSLLPVNNEIRDFDIANTTIQTVNAAIQDIAKNSNLKYINIHPLLTDAKGNLDTQYTSDGIHLNGKAYRVWKETVQNLIVQSSKFNSSIVQ